MSATLYGQKVILHPVEMTYSLSRCIALACSMEYHLTGTYEKSEDPLELAILNDKMLLVYNTIDKTLDKYNSGGSGCVLVFHTDGDYKLATTRNIDNEYITCFSKYDPLITSLLE